jgi:bla regulator protein BlaR1
MNLETEPTSARMRHRSAVWSGAATALRTLIVVGILIPCCTLAQSTPPSEAAWEKAAGSKMEFEVASIHLEKPGNFKPPLFALSPDDSYVSAGGRFFADFPLLVYIEFAYKIWLTEEQRSALLEHLPKWVSSQSFVIEGRAPGNPTKDQMRLMVQTLLEDRFKLRMHFETQTASVLALVLEKPGTTGPKLRPHDQGPACDPNPQLQDPAWVASHKDVFPFICDMFGLRGGADGKLKLGSRNTTMALLARSLPSVTNLGRPVVDQTGLTGRYDFVMEWTPEPHSAPVPVADSQENAGMTTFLEALHEQLGLKLKPAKAPIEVPIIDHVESPSEN